MERQWTVAMQIGNRDIFKYAHKHYFICRNSLYWEIVYESKSNNIKYYTEHPDECAYEGIAVIIRKTIKHHELPSYRSDFLQAINIQIHKLSMLLNISLIKIITV